MKNYLKTADKKIYEKESKKLLNRLSNNTKTINLSKCSLKNFTNYIKRIYLLLHH